MEKQFSREDATLYLKPVVSSIWSLLLVLVSLPAFGAILGSVFGQKATTFMLLVMASSVSMMVLISITYFFMPKILAKRMSGQKRWYLLYLKHEREVHVRILRFESGQFKASKSLEEGAEMLINIRNDPKAQKEKHIKAHQLRLLELQKEMDKSPKVDDSLLNRHLDVENNKLLDELIRLNSLPEDPDDKMYREHWSDVAVNAQKRAENYRLMVPKTMRSLARIDELLAEITKTK